MSGYQVGDHVVDHPPFFACRKHKTFLKLNRAFVDELLAWAPELPPQNLTDVAATLLDGDELAFRLSDYLIPPKLVLFNPRKIQGRGALPFCVILVDKRFFGIPASYLRRRIFEGCAECVAENDVSSDAAFPDYKAPAKKPAPAPTGPVARPASPKPAGQEAPPPPRQIPPRPAAPTYDAPPVKHDRP